MAAGFLFQVHLRNPDGTVVTPDIAIDRVVVADLGCGEPRFHLVPVDRLTTATEMQQLGGAAHGAAAVVLVAADAGMMVGLGSDHLDPEPDGARARQACAKPLCRDAWRYDDVAGHWGRLEVRSSAARGVSLGSAPAPGAVVRAFAGGDRLPRGTALFLSGLGADGEAGDRFAAELADPVLDRRLTLAYSVRILAAGG